MNPSVEGEAAEPGELGQVEVFTEGMDTGILDPEWVSFIQIIGDNFIVTEIIMMITLYVET
jgi:hypothetical protein